jgi:hypothetical protein
VVVISLDAPTLARLASGQVGVCYLIELDFVAATLRYTTYGRSLAVTVDGVPHTYDGLGNALSISQIRESEDTAPDQITIALSLANTGALAAALGAVETYRGRAVRVYLQLLDGAEALDGAAVRRYSGSMTKVQVAVEVDPDSGARTGRVELVCSRAGLARARHAEGPRLSIQQHQMVYAGDLGLVHLPELINTPRPWLSVAFQRQ